jgi:hypothetical protein
MQQSTILQAACAVLTLILLICFSDKILNWFTYQWEEYWQFKLLELRNRIDLWMNRDKSEEDDGWNKDFKRKSEEDESDWFKYPF